MTTQATALAAYRCILEESQSQWGEERTLLPALLEAAGAAPGSFVELGAYDGLTYSNTLALEKCFGWTGLLIEANPANHAKLARSGRAATIVHSAVCSEGVGHLRVSDASGPAASVGVSSSGVSSSGVSSSGVSSSGATQSGATRGQLVPCTTLPALMASAGISRGTFLSLDVEGAEEAVIATVPVSA